MTEKHHSLSHFFGFILFLDKKVQSRTMFYFFVTSCVFNGLKTLKCNMMKFVYVVFNKTKLTGKQ